MQYNRIKFLSVLKSLLQSVRVCGCIYNPFVYVTLVLVWRVVTYTFPMLIVHLLVIIKKKKSIIKSFFPKMPKGCIQVSEHRKYDICNSQLRCPLSSSNVKSVPAFRLNFLFIFMISLGLLNWKRRTDADTLQPFRAVPYREITFRHPVSIHIYLKATSCVLYPKYRFLFIKTVWHPYLWKCPLIYVTRWREDTILNANSYHTPIYWSNRV